MTQNVRIFTVVFVVFTFSLDFAAGQSSEDTKQLVAQCADIAALQIADAKQYAGYESCKKCHAQQVEKLETTKHFTSGDSLHRSSTAKAYVKALGLRSVKRATTCVRCHYTPEPYRDGMKAQSGISCESCHGASKTWVKLHNDYGGFDVDKSQETAAHKNQRIENSIRAGLRHPSNVFLLARSCYQCHLVDDGLLLAKTEHPVASKSFDMIRWSQGHMRHNFYRTEGKSNAYSETPRLRKMYLADLAAGIEFGLRAIAAVSETGAEREKMQLVQETRSRIEKLAKANSMVDSEPLRLLTELSTSLEIKSASSVELLSMAEKIRASGFIFFSKPGAEKLEKLDAMLPPRTEYK